jgi:hypothetical protein
VRFWEEKLALVLSKGLTIRWRKSNAASERQRPFPILLSPFALQLIPRKEAARGSKLMEQRPFVLLANEWYVHIDSKNS